jgi:hypothetical protein
MASVPVILILRSLATGAAASVLTGIIIALCLVGIAGIGLLLAPIGLATVVLAVRDLGRRPGRSVWRVAVASAAFVATFALAVVGSSLYFQR